MNPTQPGTPHHATLRALCEHPLAQHSVAVLQHALTEKIGQLLEIAIEHKLLCLLAHHATTRTALREQIPHRMRRFFANALRANQHKTVLYRHHAAQITAALAAAGASHAWLNGLSAEYRLYGGSGARQFSDLDLLVHSDDQPRAVAVLANLGFHPQPGRRALTRRLPDLLLPIVAVDLHTATAAHQLSKTPSLLARREHQYLPGQEQPVPVLNTSDAFEHCLARVRPATVDERATGQWAVCADALWLYHLMAPRRPFTTAGRRGWQALRQAWPHLPDLAPSEAVRHTSTPSNPTETA